MELRHLLYFKMVACELNFRAAAAKLCISQPPLSRQIRELEEELGVVLFERNNKRVRLTDAGVFFLRQTEELFAKLEEGKNVARQIHQSVSGELRIGYISSTYHIQLVKVLQDMRKEFPYIKTMLYETHTAKQVRALEEGRLDAGILRTPVNSHKLEIIPLFTDPFALVLPAGNNYMGPLTDVGKYFGTHPFIFFNHSYAPDFHNRLVEICRRLGFYPDIVHEANTIHSILRLVESGLGISIVPLSVKDQYPELKLSFYSLEAVPVFTEIVVAFNPRYHRPVLKSFIERYSGLLLK